MKREWIKSVSFAFAVVLSAAFSAGFVSAQQAPPPSQSSSAVQNSGAVPPAGTIGDRKENQQDRIANGVKDGQLTAGETAHLENKEAGLNKEIRTDRAANGGTLTGAEKTQINQQQNKLSNSIYADKHNASTTKFGNGEVGQRRENQQDRIAQGIKSGQLTAGETSKLESKEAGLNKEVRTDRAANGGKLTSAEKTQVNNQQNKLSNKIYQDKHNSRTQHPRK
jgi:hypothetical protein